MSKLTRKNGEAASMKWWRAHLRVSYERWNSRIRALKELMNNHPVEEAPPEAPPASPLARATRSLSMMNGGGLHMDQMLRQHFDELGGQPSNLEGQYSRSLHLSSRMGSFSGVGPKQTQGTGSRSHGSRSKASMQRDEGKSVGRQVHDEMPRKLLH